MAFLDAAQFPDQLAGESARTEAVSERLYALLLVALPILAVVAIGAIEGYVMVTSGWSPGFAVAMAMSRGR